MSLDKVVLYEILKYDYTLANVFMRTCRKMHRFIKQNNSLMDKITYHYQEKIKSQINKDLYTFFNIYDPIIKNKNYAIIGSIKIRPKNKKSIFSKTTEIVIKNSNNNTLKITNYSVLEKQLRLKEYQYLYALIHKNAQLYRYSICAHKISEDYLSSQSSNTSENDDISQHDFLPLMNMLGIGGPEKNKNTNSEFQMIDLLDDIDDVVKFVDSYNKYMYDLHNNKGNSIIYFIILFFIVFALGHW